VRTGAERTLGHPAAARRSAREAVAKDPRDWIGWFQLADLTTGREREWGTLDVGMRCDATVVDRDLATLKENELLEARVRATVTDGVVRYAAGLA